MPRTCRTRNSPQLRAVLTILSDGQPHSTRELSRRARLCDAATVVREIRGRGYTIPRTLKAGVHYYQMTTADLERLVAWEQHRHSFTTAALAESRESQS